MSNELNNIISLNSDGVEEGVAIGGDRYPGSTFLDHVLRYEDNPAVKMIVILGEVGGTEEYAVAEAVRSGQVRKPVVAWCIGTCAQQLARATGTEGIQFGHAGACANSDRETATAKNAALAAAGIHVPTSFDDLDVLIRKIYTDLVSSGKLIPKPERKPRPVPIDYAWAKARAQDQCAYPSGFFEWDIDIAHRRFKLLPEAMVCATRNWPNNRRKHRGYSMASSRT
ncbi:unnamed protein product [Echinostoma caproni]|uniref:ATP citrate synthase n=1 Tax=Echinostoma caproni TaxID=27848 RepID=A0A183AWC0_9TREM|nr:unnamed protein product [Echinostoma caproni]